ncbi:hypothetical protein [Microtetraspora malaysiensis]|uniref:Aldehyde dehydrogenase domain-containing protein n=1 Tax=Microtetraspora malaysiensis TaxID=161358 RepID=A0ABW6T0K3_9ACTN
METKQRAAGSRAAHGCPAHRGAGQSYGGIQDQPHSRADGARRDRALHAAVAVGQQSFGGARASGTNDKAGSIFNLIRWVNARTIKQTFVPPTDHRYPRMG